MSVYFHLTRLTN